ncbi:MAG: hypothetical protein K6G88_11140 [Lachnospiraceae bacterium]|nr:hypothetical protein [Lachnospiraceae bacterium]
MKRPGNYVDDGLRIGVDELTIIFGSASVRRNIFEDVNNNVQLEDVANKYNMTVDIAKKKYFSAYMRCREFMMYKDNPTSVRYLKAVRKIDRRIANRLLRAGIYDMNVFSRRKIEDVISQYDDVGLSVKTIYDTCQKLNISTMYNNSNVDNGDVVENVISKLVARYGIDAVKKAVNEYQPNNAINL